MWRRPITWVVLLAVAATAVLLSTRYIDRALPIVSLELELDRGGALESASSIATAQGWETAEYRQAASFGQRDEELKRYIELEAGGVSAWNRLVESGDHHAYQWRVRQFREGETTEAEVRFATDGTPWGFHLKLPEEEPGVTLGVEGARWIAETAATGDWGVDLSVYEPVETRQELRTGGRMDHWFVYERPGMGYGEARFRLRLAVAGDLPVEVTRFVEVPEAFERRHAEMRSANNLIALLATLSSGLLYLVLGAGVGLILLLRRRWVLWRHALVWGAVVGGLMMAATLNQLPLAWMEYDTAVGRGEFLTSQVLTAALVGIGMTLFVALVIMAGESLSRRAFPGHIQLWRVWSPGVAGSKPVLGMTLGGYAFAAFFVAYAIFFYIFASNVLGWPVSGESLLHPDLLATPFPWLSAVAISLMAGFSEEAMFRAIPLAGAALLAARFGRRGAWLGVALVVQALIFAAAHANYPQQPSYARVVELFIPSIALGLVFLRWGFLPAVVAHFAYDMAWFSVPVFASSAPGTWMNQGLLVALGLLPLGIVLAARVRHGAVAAAPADAYNGAWQPPPAAEDDEAEAAAPAGAGAEATAGAGAGSPAASPHGDGGGPGVWGLPPALVRWAPALGLAGLALWVGTERFRPASPPLEVGATEVVETAADALAAGGLYDASPESGWRLLRTTHTSRSASHRFVWETSGAEAHDALLGSYLDAPHWHVRAARFEGDVGERAEELLAEVDARGSVYRIRHTLPEEQPGAALDEAAARGLAIAAAEELWSLGTDQLSPVSAQANQRPARVDWTFTFDAPAAVTLAEGETRVRVNVAGDRVVDAVRFVHVPEQWQRERRAKATRATIISGISATLMLLLGVAAVVAGAARLGRQRLPLKVAGGGLAAGSLLIAANTVNGWPATLAQLSTSEPYGHQVLAMGVGLGFVALMGGALAGLLVALAHAWAHDAEGATPGDWRQALRLGVPAGALLTGLMAAGALVAGLLTGGEPAWGSYGGADAALPGLAAALGPLGSLIIRTLFVLLALGALARMPARGRWGIPARGLLAVGLGLVIGNAVAGDAVLPWLMASALGVALLFAGLRLVRHAGAAVVPPLVAVTILLGQVPAIIHGPYPGARPGLVVGLLLLGLAAIGWARLLPGATAPTARGPATAPEPAVDRVAAGGIQG